MIRVGFWLAVIVTTLTFLSLAGLTAAVRWWPEKTIPRLPLASLVTLHSVADYAGRSLIRRRLHVKGGEPIIAKALNGSLANQRHILSILNGPGYGAYTTRAPAAPHHVENTIEALTNHADHRLRIDARRLLSPINKGLDWNGRYVDGATGMNQAHPLGPGSWKPGPVAVRALLCLTYMGAGYDHRMPSKFKKRAAALITEFLSHQDDQGRLATADGDHAIVTLALAEAYAMTNDPALKRPTQAAVDHLLRPTDGGPEHRWSADTLLSCWDLAAQKSASVAGLRVGLDRMDAWMRSNAEFGKVWRDSGQEIPVDAQDLLAQQALFSIFLEDRSILMAIAPELLVSRPDRSECIRMWLGLCLFMREIDFMRLAADYRDSLVSEQEWNRANPDFGCMAPGNAGAHAVRMLSAQIFYRYSQ